jgi:hypothetical protein
MKNLFLLISAIFIISQALLAQNLIASYSTEPCIAFTENKGQVLCQNGNLRPDVKFIFSAPGLNMALKDNGFSYEVFAEEEAVISEATGKRINPESNQNYKIRTHRIDIIFHGAKTPEIIAEERIPGYSNYYLGKTPENGVTEVRSFKKLIYKGIYKNIDLVFYTKENKLKYDIVVHPGGNLKDMRLKYSGMDKLRMEEGQLIVLTSLGLVKERIPYSYLAESRQNIQVAYSIKGSEVSFDGPSYDKTKTLVVDPLIEWGTYFGGSADGHAIYKNSLGEIYTAGRATGNSAIATTGAHQTFLNGPTDAFIMKFDNTGTKLWGTYYGGVGKDQINGICGDQPGDYIFVTGHTDSPSGIATAGAHQSVYGGNDFGVGDAFIASFTKNGILEWGSYLGGALSDEGSAITTDGNHLYIVGNTRSTSAIATTGAHQISYGGDMDDAFLAKFHFNGSIAWATYYGGSGYDKGKGIKADSLGNVYITGETSSHDNIATTGAHETNRGAIFLAKFNEHGVRQWGTYYGIFWDGLGGSIALDNTGNIYLTGMTTSPSGISTTGAFQEAKGGSLDAFLVKFDNNGIRQWGTYFGSSNSEIAHGVDVDNAGNIFITGFTNSASGISTSGTHQPVHGGGDDAFLASFNTSGARQWCTYYGGSSYDIARGIWADGNHVFITGLTASTAGIATPGAPQTTPGGGFLAKFLAAGTGCNLSAVLTGAQSACQGAVLNYSSNTGTGLTYSWSVTGGTIISGQSTNNLSVKWDDAGTSLIKVLVSSSTSCLDSLELLVAVEALPVADFTHAVDGFNVSFLPQVGTHSSYSWSFGDGNTSSYVSPQHTYAQEGAYEVVLVVNGTNGCTQIFRDSLYVLSTGVALSKGGEKYNVYLNQHTKMVVIDYILEKPGHLSVELVGIDGRSHFSKNVLALESGTVGCDATSIAKGLYIIRVVSSSRQQVFKIQL